MPDNTLPPTHTLDELHTKLGPADPDILAAENPPEAQGDYQALGAKIASSRIVTDVERLYGLAYAFWLAATPAQKETLVGFSPELLAVAVALAVQLRDLSSATDDATHEDRAARTRVEVDLAQAFKLGLQLRDQAATLLTGIAGPDKAMAAAVADATGTAEDFDKLSKGLGRLAALGHTFLADKRPAVMGRVKGKRLDARYLTKIESAASAVKESGRSAKVRFTAKKVSQGDIDTLDGLNLHLLSDIIHAFEAGHALDPKIPRLVPISVRRWLAGALKKHPAKTPSVAAAPSGSGVT